MSTLDLPSDRFNPDCTLTLLLTRFIIRASIEYRRRTYKK